LKDILSIATAKKIADNFTHSTTKMATMPGTKVKVYRIFFSRQDHTPLPRACCSMIIHVFWRQVDFTMSTAVFSQTVGLFSFFGFPVASLRFSAGFKTSFYAACIATIRLSTIATPAYTKIGVAPTTRYSDQLYHPALKVAGV
jgi:hypothetical protein